MARSGSSGTRKATVTWLECRERPRRVPALPVNVHASLLRVPNIPLHFYRYLYWRIGREWLWVYRLRMKDEELGSIIHAPETEIRVLSIDGAPAAWNQPITRLTVSTNTLDHPAALPLYQKMGFSPVGQSEALVRPLTDTELLSITKAN